MNLQFKKNILIEKAINNLFNSIKDEDYNSQFEWDELAYRCGITPKPTKQQLYCILQKVNNLMGAEQKYLKTVCGFGKRIINPNEHGIEATRTVKKSARIYKKSGAILASTNMGKLTQEEQNQIMQQANKYKTLEMMSEQLINRRFINKERSYEKVGTLFLDFMKLIKEEKEE
jgi:hypothetical protein